MAFVVRVPSADAYAADVLGVAAQLLHAEPRVEKVAVPELILGPGKQPVRYVNPCLRYLAGCFEASAVGGRTAAEEAQVDSWLEYAQNTVMLLRGSTMLSTAVETLEKH